MFSEENFIDFKCPYCDAGVSFPEGDVGYVRQCPECNEPLVVPAAGSELGLRLPIPITTPRLVLRRFAQNDWKDLLECSDGAEEETVLRWLESDSHVRLTTPEQPFYLGIELQEAGKLIGVLSLRFTDSERLQAALEFTLNKEHEKNDVGPEAVDALLGFCFQGIKLHRVTASCLGNDESKRRILEAVGMRREGEFVKDRWVDGEWANTILYAALEEEYLE